MYITIPVHEKIFIKQGQVHPEGLKNSSEIAPFFQYSFNTHSIPFKASVVGKASTPNWSTRDAYLTIRTAKDSTAPPRISFILESKSCKINRTTLQAFVLCNNHLILHKN
ncbi:MAG: hypothetical protein SO158_07940 [Bacteroidaceae bacterium]|nr:hypothetical protein [Bacteroidaceae bacterium]